MAKLIWLILMILFLIMEANTVSLVSAWFAVGSLAALIASLFGAPGWLQITLFLATSAAALACLRPLVRKYIKPKIVPTNTDALLNSQGYVTEEIDNLAARGQVKLGAIEWTARSTNGNPIPQGTLVKVDKIEGVKVFVTPMEVKTTV
jgi:membrane protein implicated in regulation of membrane protease activity